MKTVKQLLQSKGGQIYSVTPEASVLDAIRTMSDKGVGALLVMDRDSLAGIISERDYARKVILHGKSSRDTPVGDIMTRKLVTVGLEQTVEDCMALMTANRIRHLPVLEGSIVSGVLSIGDLVKEVIAEQQETIKQLETYIHS
jgi:CBS domain-containing protein